MKYLFLMVLVALSTASQSFAQVSSEGIELYSKNFIGMRAPESVAQLQVEQWLGEAPNVQDKLVLIAFSATWCPPCRELMPQLKAIQQRFAKDMVVIEINHEDKATIEKTMSAVFPNSSPGYFAAIDSKRKLFNDLEIRAIPVVLILDSKKVVRYQGVPTGGDPLTEDRIKGIIMRYGVVPLLNASAEMDSLMANPFDRGGVSYGFTDEK